MKILNIIWIILFLFFLSFPLLSPAGLPENYKTSFTAALTDSVLTKKNNSDMDTSKINKSITLPSRIDSAKVNERIEDHLKYDTSINRSTDKLENNK
jgi:hypothetical protein